jgi:hypothetical protein
MRFLLIALGLIVALGGVTASCGPQKAYCPNLQNGDCDNVGVNGMGGAGGDGNADSGSSTVINGSGGQ